jgi:4-carboxymuconolactone decarboxylase
MTTAHRVRLTRRQNILKRDCDAILDAGDNGDCEEVGFTWTERTVLDAVTELCTTWHLRENSFAAVQARSATKCSC